jgi:hypothetical protein
MHRRSLFRKLVAAGGAGALAACLTEPATEPIPRGDPTEGPPGQHEWNGRLRRDEHGNVLLPEHHVFLSVEYTNDDPDADRAVFEAAFTDLERAYEASHRGLLVTVGYSPAYFDRFDVPLESVDLPVPEPIVPGENVATDDADLFVHLASDRPGAVLGAEEALFETGEANGLSVTPLDGLFTVQERRTGFVGAGLPQKHNDRLRGIPEDVLHEEAPFFMNFRSGFRGSQASQERVTLQNGRFAGGTTQHVSTIALRLGNWFERPFEEQVERLFSPEVDGDEVGHAGLEIGASSPVENATVADLRETAAKQGVVGHAGKMAPLREDGTPPILRRDVNSIDDGEVGLVFVSLQRTVSTFERLRLAMEGLELGDEGADLEDEEAKPDEGPIEERDDNGILQYFTVRRRGNFLVPPRATRSLPL